MTDLGLRNCIIIEIAKMYFSRKINLLLRNFSFIKIILSSLHLKNHQNFKGIMVNEYSTEGTTLRQRIEWMPEDCILFRSDFPEYHTEFVGSILSELTAEGVLVKISHGIYAKPRKSKFGAVLPSVDKVVRAIAIRDNAEVLPSGMTALNALGLSTQVPVNYTYLTTGSERIVNLSNRKVILKRGVPKNFCYGTRLISLLVQALKALKKENLGEEELNIIQQLLSKESNNENLVKDIDMMPAWMKRIIKPMLTA